jgi:hypothetical protein
LLSRHLKRNSLNNPPDNISCRATVKEHTDLA